ncbi:MAG: 3-hydroxyacyl-ACP dehydratase FabZ [Alphaproteobacteria bacterium]|nr:3-hydroxyacyl-ACP dehydratase FabZ [Alphaproteobacteria bacterium]
MSEGASTDVALDIDTLLRVLPHRYPFLMVDRVLSVDPGVRAEAIKCVTVNEPQFQGHFPNQPIMPGVLIAEAFAQVAGVIALAAEPELHGATVYLIGFDKMRFRKPVRPGDVLHLTVTKEYEKRGVWGFDCVARVGDERVANGKLMATVAHELA